MNENAKKWVERLRKNDLKQSRHELQTVDGYCCLGVACVVYEEETGERLARHINDLYNGSCLRYEMECVKKWLGLKTDLGHFLMDGKKTSLANLNDHKRLNFNQIADIIETEPEGLFDE